MSTFKKKQVVMLPTNKKAGPISIGHKSGIAEFHIFLHEKGGIYFNHTFQHLYFLSDEEIEKGDYWIDLLEKRIFKVTEEDVIVAKADGLPHNEFKKIIATTDKSIIFPERFPSFTYLPEPSRAFIEKFVEEYNKGNVITQVMVEFEEYFEYDITNKKQSLKINQRDNTITTKKTKDTWTREEVLSIINKTFFLEDRLQLEKWIEENL